MAFFAGLNDEKYDRQYSDRELVRRIIGLDRNAAKQAFANFLERTPLSADQITFVNQIVEHLAANGIMDPADLFEPPFTDRHDQGVMGVLPQYAEAIVATIERVNANAVAA